MLGTSFWLSYINDLNTCATLNKYAYDLTAHQSIQNTDVKIDITFDPKVNYIELKINTIKLIN